jgi:hypothetical protein
MTTHNDLVYDVSYVNRMVCKLGVDNNQFHLLCLLAMKERNKTSADIEQYKSEYNFHHPDGNRYIIEMIRDLEKKGLIEDLNARDEQYKYYNADLLMITPKFTRFLYEETSTMAEELWKVYPSWLWVNGKRASARSNTSLEEVEEIYSRVVKRDKRLHAKILRLVKSHYNSGIAEMGIDKFIKSRHWELLETDGYGKEEGGVSKLDL